MGARDGGNLTFLHFGGYHFNEFVDIVGGDYAALHQEHLDAGAEVFAAFGSEEGGGSGAYGRAGQKYCERTHRLFLFEGQGCLGLGGFDYILDFVSDVVNLAILYERAFFLDVFTEMTACHSALFRSKKKCCCGSDYGASESSECYM